jgi:predicted nucleotidyltransferase
MDPAALLFGAYRRDVLARLLLHPEESLHVRELARALAKPPGTLLRELNALAAAGVLARGRVGNQVHFRPIPPAHLRGTARHPEEDRRGGRCARRSPPADVRRFLYGSVARGDERARSDLDVMVVGDASLGDVVAALAAVQESLRREVNPNVFPALEFRKKLAAGDPFLKRVLAERKIFIVGGEDDLGKPAAHRPAQGARRPTPRPGRICLD